MAVGTSPLVGPPSDAPRRGASTAVPWVLRDGVLAAGPGVAGIAAWDGSPLWRVARLVLIGGLAALALAALERGGRRARSAIAFAVGLAAFPIGIGIGVPHLAKAGLHLLTVAGVVTLAAGLVLLVAGAVSLVRASPRWWRVPIVAAALLATFVATLSLGQAVAATNVPRTDIGSTTPGDRGLSYRDVELATDDGVTLSGWYVPSENGAAVVLPHGAGSTRSSVLDQAVVLAAHGFGVLLYDARGHGRSAGRAMDFGWYGDADIAAAVSFLQGQPGVDDDRIAAVGLSMGGEEAIGAAATDGRLRAVVAEGATTRTAADQAWLSDEHGWRGALQEQLERLVYATADLLTDAAPPIALRDAVAAAAPRPVLLIAAGSVPDETPAGRHIQSGAPETVELWVVPGTGHTEALDTHPAEWERRVTGFLAAALDLDPADL